MTDHANPLFPLFHKCEHDNVLHTEEGRQMNTDELNGDK